MRSGWNAIMFSVLQFLPGGFRQHGHAFILRHIAADVEVVQRDGGIAADDAGRRAACLVPQGDKAAVKHRRLRWILGDFEGRFGHRIRENNAVVGHDNFIRLCEEGCTQRRRTVGFLCHRGNRRRAQQRQRKEKGKEFLHGECLLIMMQ